MKLRETIRPPVRFSNEIVYSPISPRRSRKDNKVKKPQYIDYVPNQPPAAFPTRDFSRVPKLNGNAEGESSQNKQRSGRKSLENPCSLANRKGDSDDCCLPASLEGIPVDQLDNFIASNGDLNPIWVSNMAKMASSGENFPDDAMDMDANMGYTAYEAMVLDMEDTDVDGTMSEDPGLSSTGPQDPSWSDLSARMKAEILDNLLECYSRRTVCRMLGLTAKERRTIKDLIEHRQVQAKLEDTMLEVMRAKQLREFKKTDNSLRSRMQSQYLNFRKASRQAFRSLNELIDPDFVDFFACESSELLTARKFLRKREIEAKFAGTWGNEIGLCQTSSDGASSKMVGLDGGPRPTRIKAICLTSNQAKVPSTCTSTTRTANKPTTSQLESSTTVKQRSTASFETSPTSSDSEFHELNRDLTTPARLLTLRYKGRLDIERNNDEKGNPQQIDLNGCQDLSATTPGFPCPKNAPPEPSFEELALRQRQQSLHLQQSVNTAQRANSCLTNSLAPLFRTIENKNSDLESEHDLQRLNREPSPQRSGPLALLHSEGPSSSTQKPDDTKQYTENQRANRNQTLTKDMESHTNSRVADLNLTGVAKCDTLIPGSPSSTPTDHMGRLSSSPETKRSQFSNPLTPETVHTHTSPSTSASCGTHTGDEDEDGDEDDVLLEDEVVLIPTGPWVHPSEKVPTILKK